MIFKPVNKNRHLTCIFENVVLGTDSLSLQFVNVSKYLGQVLTNDLHDDDVLKQNSLLYGCMDERICP